MSQEMYDPPFPPREDEDQRRGSTTMPTFADIRRHVHDKATALLGQEISEHALNTCCGVLAGLVLNPSEARTRLMVPDAVTCDDILEGLTDCFAEELALLKEACWRLDQEAEARGLRDIALASWCATQLNTEFIGCPPVAARGTSSGAADACRPSTGRHSWGRSTPPSDAVGSLAIRVALTGEAHAAGDRRPDRASRPVTFLADG